ATMDIPIQAVEARALVLGAVPGFDPPASCGSVVTAVDVRTGPSPAGEWLVAAGSDVRGRVAHNSLFVSKAQRFDYPRDFPAPRQPGKHRGRGGPARVSLRLRQRRAFGYRNSSAGPAPAQTERWQTDPARRAP